MGKTVWTSEMDSDLRRMAKEGVTGTKIGEVLGVTRNAISGRAHRLGVKLGTVVLPSQKGKSKPRKRKPNIKKIADVVKTQEAIHKKVSPPVTPVLTRGPVGIFGLHALSCRWPIRGSGVQIVFCGEHTNVQPYCEKCRKLAYQASRVPITRRTK